jgi:hypothetical protein
MSGHAGWRVGDQNVLIDDERDTTSTPLPVLGSKQDRIACGILEVQILRISFISIRRVAKFHGHSIPRSERRFRSDTILLLCLLVTPELLCAVNRSDPAKTRSGLRLPYAKNRRTQTVECASGGQMLTNSSDPDRGFCFADPTFGF